MEGAEFVGRELRFRHLIKAIAVAEAVEIERHGIHVLGEVRERGFEGGADGQDISAGSVRCANRGEILGS
jgi:hypothetical protein